MSRLAAVRLDHLSIPAELRELPQWVSFRFVPNPEKAKPDKHPYQPRRPDTKAKSNDPSTWASFDEAAAVVYGGNADAVGFALTERDPYFFLDLENTLSLDEQKWIFETLDSYTERSSFGGVHVIGRGRLDDHGRHPPTLGVFDRDRFVVFTGGVIGGRDTIEDRQAELDAVIARFIPPKTTETTPRPVQLVDVDDRDLLDRAFAARNGGDFRRLYEGHWRGDYPSQSEADLALCCVAAFWTGRDPIRIDEWMRSSGLMREKWERADYRERTIEAAIGATPNVYEPRSSTSSMTSSIGHGRSAPGAPPSTSSIVPPSKGDEDEVEVTSSIDSWTKSSDEDEPERLSWVSIDLVARNARPPEPPSIVDLLYPGYNHLLSGEPEAMKTWLMVVAAVAELLAGRGVVWVDGDDVGPGAVLERLRLFGVDDATISERFAYFLPDDPLDVGGRAAVLDVVRARSCRLAVFDGFNPLLVLHGLNPNDGSDVEKFYRLLAPIKRSGVAVVITDNVVKANDSRGSWSIGSERKKSKAEVALGMKTIQPLVRGGVGKAKIVVNKDRPGFLVRPSPGLFVIDATADVCAWAIDSDTSRSDDGDFRPTVLMERVSRFLEAANAPRSRNEIEKGVIGSATWVRQAIDVLCAEGYAHESEGERRARMVELDRPYREDDEKVEQLADRIRAMQEGSS